MDKTPKEVKKSGGQGLDDNVRSHLETVLNELIPILQEISPLDHRRITIPLGEGVSRFEVESYRGFNSLSEFDKKLVQNRSLQELEEVIRSHQPELLGSVSDRWQYHLMEGIREFISPLCYAALELIESGCSISQSVSKIADELNEVLSSGLATTETLIVLNGLRLNDGVNEIRFGSNLILRRLSSDELVELSRTDFFSQPPPLLTTPFSSNALIYTKRTNVSFDVGLVQPEIKASDFAEIQEDRDKINNVLFCVSLLKPGTVQPAIERTSVIPKFLPFPKSVSYPPALGVFPPVELTTEDVTSARDIHSRIVSNSRKEFKIALSRLYDAETRLSLDDAVIDALIGLEALLTPKDIQEASFRIALNYAFLDKADAQRTRFNNLKDIQKTRNDIVHGRKNLRSSELNKIHTHAGLGKHCLRDAIYRMLLDNYFSGNREWDADFWLDRIIPPSTEDGSVSSAQ